MNANEKFGAALIDHLGQRGWHSGSRRELSVAMLHFAHQAGFLDLNRSIHALAMELKVPPRTLEGLLRDRLLYFAQPEPYGLDQFLSWIGHHNHTSLEDAKNHRLVVAVPSAAERLTIERFMDELGYVPDFKNNHRLVVIDLDRLLSTLSYRSRVSAAELLKGLKLDQQKLSQARDSYRSMLSLALEALSEQAGRHLGEATVELARHLIRGAFRPIGKVGAKRV
jgi:hypothetical protein